MDDRAIEFDAHTLDILDSVFAEQRRVMEGERGEAVRALWDLDAVRRGVGKCEEWIGVVTERLEAEAVRLANAREAEEMALTEGEEGIAREAEEFAYGGVAGGGLIC